MPRGTPDYNPSSSLYGQQITDVAELAARIGSADTVERRGSVFHVNDFSGLGADWLETLNGASKIEYVATHAFRGGIAARFYPEAGNGYGCSLTKCFPLISPSKIGLELLISSGHTGVGTISKWIIDLFYYTGTKVYEAELLYEPADNNLQILTALSPFVVFTPITSDLGLISLVGQQVYYNYLKLVVDLSNFTYTRFVWNDRGASLSAYTIPSNADTKGQNVTVKLTGIATDDQEFIYFANLILTMDEP